MGTDSTDRTIRRAADVTIGEELPARTIHVDRAALVQYAGASLDRNRIHWDQAFAQGVGLPDVIAHGMWTMGSAVQLVVDWVGDAGRVVSYGTRFTRAVVVPYDGGADIVVSGVVKDLGDDGVARVDLTVTCDGDRVLGKCIARVALDV